MAFKLLKLTFISWYELYIHFVLRILHHLFEKKFQICLYYLSFIYILSSYFKSLTQMFCNKLNNIKALLTLKELLFIYPLSITIDSNLNSEPCNFWRFHNVYKISRFSGFSLSVKSKYNFVFWLIWHINYRGIENKLFYQKSCFFVVVLVLGVFIGF